MNRLQRRWHAGIWLVLEPLILLGLAAALAARPPALDSPDAQAAGGPNPDSALSARPHTPGGLP